MHDERRKRQESFFDPGHVHDLFEDFDDAIDAWHLSRKDYMTDPTERRAAVVRATSARVAETHGQLLFALETERCWREARVEGGEQ